MSLTKFSLSANNHTSDTHNQNNTKSETKSLYTADCKAITIRLSRRGHKITFGSERFSFIYSLRTFTAADLLYDDDDDDVKRADASVCVQSVFAVYACRLSAKHKLYVRSARCT